ncbi:DNA methylase, adenine-specific [uncultured Caudovirales phage]|uniref:site-specific DNA-methyltransferase (adenine-specific) n=1 Tax=uncultured Caudovirales phage TaxID=2100421 RepID=A0A6J5NMQ0_9CAUD|nr:DNA methylase, adenine-specific [uncultured Caudovirales phage]
MNISEFAQQLATKTKILKNELLKDLNNSETLIEIKDSIQKNLISDITEESFVDLFAQTISYSMFAAKQIYNELNKESNNFKFEDIVFYMPQSNPFLKQFFYILEKNSEILNEDVSKSIHEIFELVKNSNLSITQHERGDLLIHFYEDFLQYYSPETRKNLGVWYTPEPIVDYMIDMSQLFLKDKLNINGGFLNNEYCDEKYSKVQVLDPATGTGNFLVRIATRICDSIEDSKERFEYIRDHLINKLNGFELLMTSYTIANFKLDQLFRHYGYKVKTSNGRQRTNIYLTNTLDKVPVNEILLEKDNFVGLLARETEGANQVKENKPVFVVIGNPPYNGNSKNNNEFINGLMQTYKPDFNVGPGLNDDYIKFFRYAHDLINKKKTGLVSFITNNSFIKSQACQEMRISLLKDFDEIYILNLNGDKTKEDKNVFDIKTNVCITFLIKTGLKDKDEFGEIFYADLIGSKESKFQSLQDKDFQFQKLTLEAPNYFFIPLDNELLKVYNEGFSLGDIFKLKGQSILTAADELVINTKLDKLKSNIDEYINGATKLKLGSTVLSREKDSNGVYKILPYRVFDNRHYYDSKISAYQRNALTKHESIEDNYYLNLKSGVVGNEKFSHICFSKKVSEATFFTGGKASHSAPLYIYNEQNKIESNIKESFIKEINNCVGDTEIQAKHIMDYIYGYLNMPSYVEKYNDLLKQNYPRVPYPKDYDEFYRISNIGAQLRCYHLFSFEIETIPSIDIEFPCKINVNNKLEFSVNNDIVFQLKNDIWEFKIGACQVLKNWIKARVDEEITFEEFLHFLKMITAIEETIKLRKKLNES